MWQKKGNRLCKHKPETVISRVSLDSYPGDDAHPVDRLIWAVNLYLDELDEGIDDEFDSFVAAIR